MSLKIIWFMGAVWLGLNAHQRQEVFGAEPKASAFPGSGGGKVWPERDRFRSSRSDRGQDLGLPGIAPHQLRAVHGPNACAKGKGASPGTACHEGVVPTEMGMFVVLAERDMILTSPNAKIWCLQTSEVPPDCHKTVGGNGILVRVGPRSGIETSSDGVSWTARNSGVPNRLYATAFGNGLFVAVGNEGALVTSADGIKWTAGNSRTDQRLRGVVFGQGRFVAVGYEGTILSSGDGRQWTSRRSGTDEQLMDVTCGRGLFVAVGCHGTALSSQNAVSWSLRNLGASLQLRSIIFRTDPSLATEQTAGVSNR